MDAREKTPQNLYLTAALLIRGFITLGDIYLRVRADESYSVEAYTGSELT